MKDKEGRGGEGPGNSPLKGMGKLGAFRVKKKTTSSSQPFTEMPQIQRKIQPTPHGADSMRSGDTCTVFSLAPEHSHVPCLAELCPWGFTVQTPAHQVSPNTSHFASWQHLFSLSCPIESSCSTLWTLQKLQGEITF